MKFTKNTGASVSISIISLIIFNAVTFLAPFLHTVTFWLGYCFATMSIVVLLISSLVFFGKSDPNAKFLSIPQFNVALIYFILQIALSFAEMTNSFLTYKIAIIINCVLIAVFLIAFLLVGIGKSAVESRDSYTNSKRFYIKNIQTELELITVSSSRDNIESAWVKNEWSRFLTLRQKDSSKTLIPLYFDMLKSDLPDEFAILSSQNIKENDFEQELFRGIKKLIPLPIMLAQKRKKRRKRFGIAALVFAVILIISGAFSIPYVKDYVNKNENYKQVMQLYYEGNYPEAA